MDEVALISSRTLSVKAWLALIATREDFVNYPNRYGVNPFTGEPVEIRPPASTVRILKDGTDIGAVSWAHDGSNRLIVGALPDTQAEMLTVAQEIAAALQADVHQL